MILLMVENRAPVFPTTVLITVEQYLVLAKEIASLYWSM